MDSTPTAIAENDYISALNISGTVGGDGQFNIVSNLQGNTLVSYALPAGYNKVIGQSEDLQFNTLFYFVYNSNNQHSILRFYPLTNTIVKVSQDSVYGWTLETQITHIDFVDGRYLYWIDPQPRELDVIFSTDNKQREYQIIQTVFDDPNPLNNFYTFTVYDDNGNVLATNAGVIASNYDDLATALNALFPTYIIAESFQNYVLVTIIGINTYTVTYTNTNGQDWAIAIPNNFYPSLNERVIYRGKYPHQLIPQVSLVNDPNKAYNLIFQKNFQFMVKIVMWDNSHTVFSPISDLTLTDCATQGYNGIRINFTDDTYYDIATLAIIQRVELVAREGNSGRFFTIKVLERYQLWDYSNLIHDIYFDFYNDANYQVVEDSETLRAWDAVGRTLASQVYADNRLFDGNPLENYNKPAPQGTFTGEFTEASKGKIFNLYGLLKIWSDDFFGVGSGGKDGFIYNLGEVDGEPTPDVWGGSNSGEVRTTAGDFGQQFAIGQSGWVIYDATNTNNYTISRQADTGYLPVTATGALSAATAEERQAIVDFMASPNFVAGQTFYSNWNLKLFAGVHTIRVASQWVSFGDGLGKGEIYNLNGQRWYKTSTSIKTFTDQGGVDLGQYVYEIRVEIDLDGTYRLYSQQSTIPFGTGTADAQGNIYAGEIIVSDKISVQDNSEWKWCLDGYLIDADASSDNDALATNGLFMERQLIEKRERAFTYSILGDETIVVENYAEVITDHNGYFYFRLDGVNKQNDQNVSKTIAELKCTSINGLIAYDWFDNFKLSNEDNSVINGSVLFNLFNNSLLDTQNYPYNVGNFYANRPILTQQFDEKNLYYQILIYNNNIDISKKNRTRIQGTARDANGVGIGGLSVLYERNGRQEYTGADGSFEIFAYGDYKPLPNNNRRIDSLTISNLADCEVRFSGNLFYITKPDIVSLSGMPYGDSALVPSYLNYDIGIIDFIVISAGNRYLKSGGNYKWALLYCDEMLRRSDLVLLADMYIPFLTENRQNIRGITNTVTSGNSNGYFTFTLNLNGTPPSWAKYVYLLRTLDATYNFYLQFPAFDIKYVVSFDGTTAQETTYETSTANQIWVNISESLVAYNLKYPDSTKSYTFTEGDRLKIISNGNGQLLSDAFDFKIIGEQALGNSVYLIIESQDTFPKLEGGALFEIYTPKLQTDTAAYFEIHTVITISNGTYDQTVIPINTGDTYRRTRIVPVDTGVAVNFIEDQEISDFYPSQFQDIGRISFSNPNFKEIQRVDVIRFSGKFYEDTKINNLSSFELLNLAQLPKFMGAINAMRVTNDDGYRAVLLTICENNTGSAYIGDAILSDVTGENFISLSNKVIPAVRILKGDYGTTNPESVASKDGRVWWWDNQRKRVIRYSLNGLTPISDYKMKSFFNGLNPDYAQGGFDVYREQYVITPYNQQTGIETRQIITGSNAGGAIITIETPSAFSNGQTIVINGEETTVVNTRVFNQAGTEIEPYSIEINRQFGQDTLLDIVLNQQTVVWDEPRNRWVTFLTQTPEKWAFVNDTFISFKNGELWVEYTNLLRNNYYGVQSLSNVQMAFNVQPFMVKLWFNIRVQANNKWSAPNTGDIELMDNQSYPTGMVSRLKADNFQLKEGQYWSNFLRDMNDPRFNNPLEALLRGRMLRGEVLIIKLQNSDSGNVTLRTVECFSYQSMKTEP